MRVDQLGTPEEVEAFTQELQERARQGRQRALVRHLAREFEQAKRKRETVIRIQFLRERAPSPE